MIDERTIELINGDIDGVLSREDKDELIEILKNSAEAKNYYRDLEQLDGLLLALPDQELNADFHQKIVSSVTPSTNVTSIKRKGVGGQISTFMSYGLATAAGVFLAIGYYETRQVDTEPQDIDQMIGTMAPGAKRSVAVDSFKVNEGGVQSHASLERRNGKLVLDITIDSDEVTDISVDFGSADLGFDAMAQIKSQLESFHIAGHMIQVRSKGRQRFTVLLHKNNKNGQDDKDVVKLKYSRDGALVQQGTLSAG